MLDRLAWRTAAITALMITAMVLYAAWSIDVAHRAALEHIRTRADQMANVFAAHTSATVRWIDALILELDRSWTPDLHTFILRSQQISAESTEVSMQISSADATGVISWSSISGRQPVDLRDREHVRVHLEERVAGLFVSAPVLGRVSKRWTIQFTRAIRRAGVLKAVVVFSVDPAYLSRFYGSLPLEPGDSITVLRQDGTVLARAPGEGELLGRKLANVPYIGPEAPEQGTSRIADPLDGVMRSHAWKKSQGADLTVAAALSEADALEAFRSQRLWIVAATLGLSLMLIVSAAALLRALRWRSRLAGQLRSEKATLETAVAERTQELSIAFEHLRAAQAGLSRMAAIVEHSRDAIVSSDLQGVVQTWNPGAERIYGYSAREMIGEHIRRLARPEDWEGVDEDSLLLAAGQTLGLKRVIRVGKDGRELRIDMMRSPVRDSEGKVVAFSMIARDVTEQVRMEEQLRESQKLEAIGQLTGGLAHDFNNLLGVVVGNLDLLAEKLPEDETLKRRHRAALEAALRGAEVTRSLLAVARRQPLKVEVHDLNGLLVEMLPLVRSSVGSAVTVRSQLSSGELAARVDAAGLSNALLNLVINARDAMREQSAEHRLVLRTRIEHIAAEGDAPLAEGNYAVIEVGDSGPGMSEEVRQKAFEPFFTTKEVGKGTGLGLSMVRGFAEQLGGTARIDSEAGRGTTVRLYLPLDAVRAAPEQAKGERRDAAASGDRTEG